MRNQVKYMKQAIGITAFLVTLLGGAVLLATDTAAAAPVNNNAAIGTMSVMQPVLPGVKANSNFNPAFNQPFFARQAFNPFFARPAFNPFFARPFFNPFFAGAAFNPFLFDPFFTPFVDVDVDAVGAFGAEFD
jgi:hypothetical protein